MSILKKLLKITKNIKIPVALAILLVASVYIASANLDGWQYHKNVIIKENSGNTLKVQIFQYKPKVMVQTSDLLTGVATS